MYYISVKNLIHLCYICFFKTILRWPDFKYYCTQMFVFVPTKINFLFKCAIHDLHNPVEGFIPKYRLIKKN